MTSNFVRSETPTYPSSMKRGERLLSQEETRFFAELEHEARRFRHLIDDLKRERGEDKELDALLSDDEKKALQAHMKEKLTVLGEKLNAVLLSVDREHREGLLDACYGTIWDGLEIDINKGDEALVTQFSQELLKHALLLSIDGTDGKKQAAQTSIEHTAANIHGSMVDKVDDHLL